MFPLCLRKATEISSTADCWNRWRDKDFLGTRGEANSASNAEKDMEQHPRNGFCWFSFLCFTAYGLLACSSRSLERCGFRDGRAPFLVQRLLTWMHLLSRLLWRILDGFSSDMLPSPGARRSRAWLARVRLEARSTSDDQRPRSPGHPGHSFYDVLCRWWQGVLRRIRAIQEPCFLPLLWSLNGKHVNWWSCLSFLICSESSPDKRLNLSNSLALKTF